MTLITGKSEEEKNCFLFLTILTFLSRLNFSQIAIGIFAILVYIGILAILVYIGILAILIYIGILAILVYMGILAILVYIGILANYCNNIGILLATLRSQI